MADQSLINDETALSYAEGMMNWTRGLRHLEAVVRYVRDARREIPALTEALAKVRAEYHEAQASADAHRALKAEADQLRSEVGKLTSKRDALTGELSALESNIGARKSRVDALQADEATLRSRIAVAKSELDGLRQRLAPIVSKLEQG
jgi:chromosome segregation ATPase